MNIRVLPPDVNHSQDHFSVEGDCIRFGLGAIKNVGRGLNRTIVTRRESGGLFRSLEDFLQRMNGGELNKRAVENFIKCGAMDCFGNNRRELLSAYENMMDSINSSRKRNLEGQLGLFGMMEEASAPIPIPAMQEFGRAELMSMEKETTGMYISGHPMDDYRIRLKGSHVVSIGSLMADGNPYRDEQIISVAGIVQSIKMKTTRSGSMMAYVTVEDDTATVEMLAFSNVLSQYGGYIRENEAVVVTGRLSLRDDKEPQIVVNRVRPISDFSPNEVDDVQEEEPVKVYTGMLYLRLATEDGPMFRKVKAILNMFPGENQVVVYFADTKLRRGTRCTLDSRMVNELKNVLGNENVVLK